MQRSKGVLVVAVLSALALVLTGCSAKVTDKGPLPTLKIGAVSSVDIVPIVIAQEQGYFTAAGVNVTFEPFKSAQDRDAAFQSGALDGIICDEIAICLYQNAGFDVKITGITDGDFMLVAGPTSGIKTVQDLKGKSVAISEKTAIEFTLDSILANNGLQPGDVTKTVVPAVPTRLELLLNNKVDAALLPEPFSSSAVSSGCTLLGSASQLATYPSVVAFSQPTIAAKNAEIAAFFKGCNRAADYINSTPIAEYEATVMQAAGYPDTMKGKIVLPKFRQNALPPEAEVQSAIDWATNKGLLTKPLTPRDVMVTIPAK